MKYFKAFGRWLLTPRQPLRRVTAAQPKAFRQALFARGLRRGAGCGNNQSDRYTYPHDVRAA